MNSYSYNAFCGIDISKDTFDYCFINQNKQILEQGKFPITQESLNFIKDFALSDVNQNTAFLLESTGKYHYRVSNFLISAGFDVFVVQPLLIKKYYESKDLRKTKTDKKDARLIAEYGVDNHNTLYLYNPEYDPLKELLRFRSNLIREMTAKKNALKLRMISTFPELVGVKKDFIFTKTILSLLRECCLPNELCKKRISTIEKMLKRHNPVRLSITAFGLKEMAKTSIGCNNVNSQLIITEIVDGITETMTRISKVDAEIEKQAKDRYENEIKILTSIKGIGKVMAISFLIESKDIRLYSDWKKLSAYAGIDPSVMQSGSSVNKPGKISKRGNRYLRYILFLMADSVRKFCPRYNQYYEKKLNEGKKYKVRIIAVANKLVKLIFVLLQKGECYEENYENNLSLAKP